MKTTLKWVNLNKWSRYLTMEWWDKSDLFTDNEVPSLGTVLHCCCHPDVAYCAFPPVIFPTYVPVFLNKALRFTRTNSLSCFTPQCLQQLCPRFCLHNSLELVTDTPLQSVLSSQTAHIWRNSWNMLFDQNDSRIVTLKRSMNSASPLWSACDRFTHHAPICPHFNVNTDSPFFFQLRWMVLDGRFTFRVRPVLSPY